MSMKKIIYVSLLLLQAEYAFTQSGNPANFHIDGNAVANNPVAGTDDWYRYVNATGLPVIDTNGAAVIRQNLNAGHFPFSKRMVFNNYSVQSGRLFLDALFARDYHTGSGTDRTVMLGSSTKNCANPMTEWRGGAGSMGGSANDLIDVYAHARRAGLTIGDSLWIYGGIAYNTPGGAHYFDYEFYQSPITFVEPPSSNVPFLNSGADEGHTAWHFDGSGNVVRAGDLIVAIGYGNGGLSSVEIRIWVSKSDYNNVLPAKFNWGGDFDQIHNSRTYGYARIQIPAGAIHYAINSAAANIACGPWGFPASGTVINNYYSQYQFFEFALNFSALGIDPGQIPGQDPCSAPFSKLLVKSRVGNGFNADLKDFAGPYDFLNLPAVGVNIGPDRSLCIGRDTIMLHANPTAAYGSFHWTSLYGDGIVSNPDSVAVFVNLPGIYILQSMLYGGCAVSNRDTVIISNSSSCLVLPIKDIQLRAKKEGSYHLLTWETNPEPNIDYFIIEYSSDGHLYKSLSRAVNENKATQNYKFPPPGLRSFYRIKAIYKNGAESKYSNIVTLSTPEHQRSIYKKAGKDIIVISSSSEVIFQQLEIFDLFGAKIFTASLPAVERMEISTGRSLAHGIYHYRLSAGTKILSGSFLWD